MIDYVDFDTVDIGGRRHYQISKDLKLPSITTVLGAVPDPSKAISLQSWRDRIGEAEAKSISTEAARRGTAVHDLAEIYLLKQPRSSELATAADEQLFNTIKPRLNKHVTKIYGMEKVMFSVELGIAGRTDLICEWDGVPSIVDIKTSSKMKRKEDITDYWIQTCFYSVAHDEMYGTCIENTVIVMAVADGLPLVFSEPREKYLELLINKKTQYDNLFGR